MKKAIIGVLSITLVTLIVLTINLTIKYNKLITESESHVSQGNGTSSDLPYADSPNIGTDVDLVYSYTEQEIMGVIDGLEIVDLYSQKKITFDGGRAFIEDGINRYYREFSITKENGIYNLHVDDCIYEITQSSEGLVVNCNGSLYKIEVN